MIEKFLYKCPICMAEESIETKKSGSIVCNACGAQYSYTEDYQLSITAGNRQQTMTLREAYEKICAGRLSGVTDETFTPQKGEVLWAKSSRAKLFEERKAGVFRGYKKIRAQLYRFCLVDTGNLYLTNKRLLFHGIKDYEIGLGELSSVTIESHSIMMNTKRGYALSISFIQESGKKWEDYIRRAVQEFHGKKRIAEYHPRITFH
jgi:DNA-directed RNA polymerase subunit RPC12/RpoP